MDATTLRLVDFASRANFSGLPAETVHECKCRLIDTFACAVGAFHEPVSRMARTLAKRFSGTSPAASVWGCPWKTTPEAAAFANGVMLRFLDFNDMYHAKSVGHPSDVIAGILAVGEAVHADGASVINAITLAYDIYCSFCEAVEINSKGWDNPVYVGLAAAVGAGKLLHLSPEQMGDAISLSLAPNMTLAQTRHGELSNWKGCAAANASRNGVFAAFLARDGFTGPTAVFEGKGGLWDIVGRFDWQVTIGPVAPHRVTRIHMKRFQVCYNGQSAVGAALEIRPRVRVNDINGIQIEVYQRAVEMMGNDPARWAPKTRETADHSLPYVVAIALLDGELTAQSYSSKRLVDPAVVNLMRKVKVNEDAEFSAQFPESAACRLRVRMTSGEVLTAEVRYPKGHINNPMDDRDLEAKFRDMFRAYGDENQCEAALRALWDLDRAKDIGDVLTLFVTPFSIR